MSIQAIKSPSLRTLFNRTINSFNPAVLGRAANDERKHDSIDDKQIIKSHSITKKALNYKPIAKYKQHTLHYVLKTIGYLPTPVLEGFVSYLGGPTSKQYLHANAHLRLIIAVNGKLKTPLQLAEMNGLRKRFAADAVAMQTPKVWQQARTSKLINKLNDKNFFIKNRSVPVSWQDKTIANADAGDMNVRCYQAGLGSKSHHNPDQMVMLFFHGGGFCIGDLNTHHEFCHAVCAQTGWAVVSVDYRLAPEYPAPTALQDCIAAYAWVAEHCHTLGASAERIVLAGDSAGGCLTALVAQHITLPIESLWLDLGLAGQKTFNVLQHLPHPLAQMPLYPVTDANTDYPSWDLYGKGLLLDYEDIVVFDTACMQFSPLSREHVLISPMLGDNRRVCPTFVVAAELDVLHDEAFAYAEQLKTYGIAVQTHKVLGAPHGFIHFMSVHQGLEQQTNYIIQQFAQFVHQVLSDQEVLSVQKTLAA